MAPSLRLSWQDLTKSLALGFMSISGTAGVSAIQIYVPQYRVDLKEWCEWTDSPFDKVSKVVGLGFRMPGPRENVYTMAATAVLKLIQREDLDARSIGFLALGTESSTDNAAGAVIVKGMVDRALQAMGKAGISRNCEVPEFKHACLGGIYATKAAIRWCLLDGRDRLAIVISADVAEYARNSTGEQTQGAGAVAMLVESSAKMLAIDLGTSGSSSAYRGPDFRKPVARHFTAGSQHNNPLPPDGRIRDFPVFNGRYSTHCYLDQVVHACHDHLERSGLDPLELFESQGAVFFHRPYHHLPTQALATSMVFAWGRAGASGRARLEALCAKSGCDADAAWDQLSDQPDLESLVHSKGPDTDPYAAVTPVVKALRASPEFRATQTRLLRFGDDDVKELGNLYTASLPAWLACGLADAATRPRDLASDRILAIGYGSGDAAEVLPCTLVAGWQEAAQRIDVQATLAESHNLSKAGYAALHAGIPDSQLPAASSGRFLIESIGEREDERFQDIGIERYQYLA